MGKEVLFFIKNCERRLWDAMVSSSIWLLLDVLLIFSFFVCSRGARRQVGSVYTRNAMIPFISLLYCAVQVDEGK